MVRGDSAPVKPFTLLVHSVLQGAWIASIGRAAMTSAVAYIEMFEKELRNNSSEAERLRDEILSLKLLNSENAQELEKKLKAMQSLTSNRIWFERAFAFFIGILSSLAASYFWQILQSRA